MINIDDIRKQEPATILIGMHPGVIQSILDYDHLLGRKIPSIKGIVARGRKKERFFWGSSEVELPLYASIDHIPSSVAKVITTVVNVQSARNVKKQTLDALGRFKALSILTIFAEGTPERHALDVIDAAKKRKVLISGPSSVGVLVPGSVKAGAIGGTMYEQLVEAGITSPGDVAVITTSGGMVNELIRVVTNKGRGVSFAVAMGGDRYPILDPAEAMLIAENDPQTKEIVYFGELGGVDEYKIIQLVREGKLTKRIVAYVAGVVAELFTTPPQFGHAKALAQNEDESASAKKTAMRQAGIVVCDRFDGIAESLAPGAAREDKEFDKSLALRRRAYFMSHISGEKGGNVHLLGRELLDTVEANSVASLTLSMLLGHQIHSKKLINFTDFVLRLLVDHSPNVSGAVNTMVTARAGKDLVSSLAAGLLTIGPRFGGAVNGAADVWLSGVSEQLDAKRAVLRYVSGTGVIPGIGHKKYRLDNPDPRVAALLAFDNRSDGAYLAYAKSVEKITTSKKSNLILNVDGAIAAVMLDLLESELGYNKQQLRELVDIEFFNSLFVISRTIGLTSHYLDQRRNDEGLFRLSDDDLTYFS